MARLEYFDDLLNYWHRLRAEADGVVPSRQQFNPMEVPKLLPFMFMVERQAPEELMIRLVGTALDGLTGSPATGSNVLDRYGAQEREAHLATYDNLFSLPCGAWQDRLLKVGDDPCYHTRTILLPFADRQGAPRYVIGISRVRRHHGDASEGDLHQLGTEYIDLGFGVPNGG
ncbi:PAS domain-containing protein [Kordiimonas marina]|uniref:PAS domain-containing protein n=1 Tax=Kordiimonas marina TaxID=2872312 RepID=UPI001FF62141|nr:PAS domain-containing protein [Kordiimonas marina]